MLNYENNANLCKNGDQWAIIDHCDDVEDWCLVNSDQADDVTDYSDRRQTLVMMIKFVIFLGSTSFAFAQSLLNLNRLRNGACC